MRSDGHRQQLGTVGGKNNLHVCVCKFKVTEMSWRVEGTEGENVSAGPTRTMGIVLHDSK